MLVEALELDVNAQSAGGRCALHAAAERGVVDTMRTLLNLGARPSIVDSVGISPLLLARLGGHAACARLLVMAQQRLGRSSVNASLPPLPERLIDYVLLLALPTKHGGGHGPCVDGEEEARIELRCPREDHIDFALPAAVALRKVSAHAEALASGRAFTTALSTSAGHQCYVACVEVGAPSAAAARCGWGRDSCAGSAPPGDVTMLSRAAAVKPRRILLCGEYIFVPLHFLPSPTPAHNLTHSPSYIYIKILTPPRSALSLAVFHTLRGPGRIDCWDDAQRAGSPPGVRLFYVPLHFRANPANDFDLLPLIYCDDPNN